MVQGPDNTPENDTTEEVEEEEEIVYNTEDFISKAYFSPQCSMPDNFFELHSSYGFEAVKRYNICVVDDYHVIHWSGTIMHIVNIKTSLTTFRRCNDAGYGYITKHPHLPYFAVGEKGVYPYIIMYEWPTFKIIQVMKRGTKAAYSFLDFSPDGELLASQGCAPDHTLTLWHWAKGWVLLRCKAHTQDVYRTEFSRHFPGRLISSGSGHIKFWTMADTFTGLKLQGKLGKFGKTPISDTCTYYGLSDGLIISAAENGNMLIWESCQIKMEIIRGKSDPCHNGVITFFEYDADGDLLTLGSEGKMRCWDFASILKGKPKGDRKYVSGLASFEMDIKDDFGQANIQYVIKMSQDPESPLFSHYIAQDSKGSVWKLHLALKGTQEPPIRLFLKHRGPIVGMGASPGDYFVGTLGYGGKLMVHNAKTNRLITAKQFQPCGSAMVWLPGTMVVILGFDDGTLRVTVLSLRQADARHKLDSSLGAKYISCIQALKPHSSRISCFSLREEDDLFASGSDDASIFIYRLVPYKDYVKLVPCGLMTGPGPVYSLSWKFGVTEFTILACCTNGRVTEATFQGIMEFKPSEKYLNPVEVSDTVFRSVKSEILRDAVARAQNTKRTEKLKNKKAKLAKMKEENPGIIIDEGLYLHDSEEEEELPALYYPAKPCTIFFARYIDGRYWLSPSGYDAGFVYLYHLGSDAPSECIPITDAGDIEISAIENILSGSYLFLGLGNGKIRVVKIDQSKPFDFSDYMEMRMHDCEYGRITKICFSHDLRYVYTCGTDSNLFAYKLKLSENQYLPYKNLPPLAPIPDYAIDGIIPKEQPSLQEINATAKLRELEGEAAEMMQLKLKELQYMGEKISELWDLNDLLPKEKRLTVTDMEIHPKFTRFLRQEFEEKLSIWEKKLQFDYEKAKILYKKVYTYYMKPIRGLDVYISCLKSKAAVKTYRMRSISNQFAEAENFVSKMMEKRQQEKRPSKDVIAQPKLASEKKKAVDHLPTLDANMEKYVPLLSPQEKILYDAFQKRRSERSSLIEEIAGGRPDAPKESSQENPANTAKQGRKLKTDAAFRLPFSKRITKQLKLAHIIRTFNELWTIKEEFNKKVIGLRELKNKEMANFKKNSSLHRKMLEHIPPDEALQLPVIPPVDIKKEYPELYYTAEADEVEKNENDDETEEVEHHPELDIIDPQVIEYYNNTHPRTPDLEEYYAIKIYPSIIRLKKLQDKMIYETNGFMENFDSKVKDLIYEKMEYGFKTNQIELYLGTLLQEMSIISRYQFLEESTQKSMQSYLAINAIYSFKLFVRRKRIIKKENNIDIYNDKIKDIVTEFQNMVAGSKFAKHLTSLFKKKYRPPKKEDDDDSESESSSSEDESSSEKDDEDEGEMAAYKFDETICPDGCDPYIFNRVFKLRQSRHDFEAKVLACKKDIATNQHDMVGMRRILKIDSVLLAIYQLQLDRISREKQAELNQVNLLLIVDSSQLQNWQIERKQYIHPKDLVVASVRAIKELRESKRQLSITASALRSQSKQHNMHKMRLKKDISKFEDIYKTLLMERKESLIQKFGIETNVYTLDVEATRRLLLSKAYDVVLDERFGLIKQLKDRMYDEKEKLAALKKMHANNLFTLAAIESEKYKTIKNEQKLKKKHLHEYITEEQLDSDLKNLEYILCQQRALKERLKNEVRFLKFRDMGPVAKMTKEVASAKTSVEALPSITPSIREDATPMGDVAVIPQGMEEPEIPPELMESLSEERKSLIAVIGEAARKSIDFDQDVMKFEDIFSRILKQVIPSEILIEEIVDEQKEESEELDEIPEKESSGESKKSVTMDEEVSQEDKEAIEDAVFSEQPSGDEQEGGLEITELIEDQEAFKELEAEKDETEKPKEEMESQEELKEELVETQDEPKGEMEVQGESKKEQVETQEEPKEEREVQEESKEEQVSGDEKHLQEEEATLSKETVEEQVSPPEITSPEQEELTPPPEVSQSAVSEEQEQPTVVKQEQEDTGDIAVAPEEEP